MNIRTRITVVIAAASLSAAALAGCTAATGAGGTGSDAGQNAGSSAAPSTAGSSAAGLATASTSLGTIVVDGTGMTVYVYDKDTAGATTSACTGSCTGLWPAVESASATPSVTGVTGTIGTITGTDGKLQVTLNGLPLYRYSGDTTAGDTNGQGVDGIWWAVAADGTKITSGSTSNY
jgi:predicted lipoprotein with Yx(FWY)xxD motif